MLSPVATKTVNETTALFVNYKNQSLIMCENHPQIYGKKRKNYFWY